MSGQHLQRSWGFKQTGRQGPEYHYHQRMHDARGKSLHTYQNYTQLLGAYMNMTIKKNRTGKCCYLTL